MKIKHLLGCAKSCVLHKLFGWRYPLIASLSLTGKCNAHCLNCYSGRSNHVPNVKELIDRIDKLYLDGTRIWFLHGGEPTLHPNFLEILKYVSSRGYVSVSTNGSRPDILKRAVHANMIQLSLDGDDKIHDVVRGVRDSYQNVIDSANALFGAKIPFSFHMVVRQRDHVEKQIIHVAEIAKYFKTWMVACVWMPSGCSNEGPDRMWTQHCYRTLIKLVRRGDLPIRNSIDALEHALNWPLNYDMIGCEENLDVSIRTRNVRCVHGRLTAWVDEHGKYYPCTVAYRRPEFCFDDWKSMGAIQCWDCGTASELPYLLGLNFRVLLDWMRRLL